MLIRTEQLPDRDAIQSVHRAAFETPAEANLVDALRSQATPVVSLVAELNNIIVGHIIFSPVTLSGCPTIKVAGLAPMAVAPEHQRKGVGSRLVPAGLEQCRDAGFEAAVVLGHPEYYPRFGFSPASDFGLRSEYDVPADVFMAMELVPQALVGRTGTVRYHTAFANV